MPNFLLILTNIMLAVSGQTLIKQGIIKIGSFSTMPLLKFFQKSLLSPLIILGVSFYAVSTLIWFMVLSKVELSVAYPALSLGYILILVVSFVFLDEPLTTAKIIGVLLICSGTFLIFRR